MAVSVVSFSFSRAAQPEAQRPTQSEVPRAPSARWWLSLPQLVSGFFAPQLTDFLSSRSYIIVQSPTQSLEWHVCSSSSGNNCHGVHKLLSSGASVYECTMGFLPCPISSAKSAYAISSHNCHRNVSLPSGTSLWNGMFGRVEGQHTTHGHSFIIKQKQPQCTCQTPSTVKHVYIESVSFTFIWKCK